MDHVGLCSNAERVCVCTEMPSNECISDVSPRLLLHLQSHCCVKPTSGDPWLFSCFYFLMLLLSPPPASFLSHITVYWRPKAQGLSLLKRRLASIRDIPAIKTFFLATGERGAFGKTSWHLFLALWVKTTQSPVYLPGDMWTTQPLQRQREAVPLIAVSSVMLSLLLCVVPATLLCPRVLLLSLYFVWMRMKAPSG